MPNAINDIGSAIRSSAAAAPQSGDRDRLRKATREMESYFVGTLLKKMHETASKGGLFEEKSESATYREMLDDAIAAEIGKRGAFGIADTLFKQLVVSFDALQPIEPAASTVAGSEAVAANTKKQDRVNNGGKDNQNR